MEAFPIKHIELPEASDDVLLALHGIQSRVNLEQFPSDPPVPAEQRLKDWRAGGACWTAWTADHSRPVAITWVGLSDEVHERHVVNFTMLVLPEYRRRGIGRRMLQVLANIGREAERSLLMTQTQRSIPAGGIFAERIGARSSMESRSLQLDLVTLPLERIAHWQAQAAERAPGFVLSFWQDAYPEAELARIARLHEVHNDAPHRGETIGDKVITPEDLQQSDQELLERGDRRLTAFVREPETGMIVGFSEVTWNPLHPTSVEQGTTAVLHAYRKRGLGHWLKGALLQRLRREQPDARFVRTGNAADNLAMLCVNQDLGFRVISEDTWWEFPLEAVERYLHAATRAEA